MPGQLQLPFVVQPSAMNWQERLVTLHETFRFLPTTRQELNMAIGAISFMDEPFGVGKHLNEVLLHQRSNPDVELPDRSLKAVVRDMGTFLNDATDRRKGLLEVHKTLAEGINPTLNVEQVAEDLDLQGLLSAIQHSHVLMGMRSGSDLALRGGIKKPKSETKKRLVTGYDTETHDHISALLVGTDVAAMKVRDFKSLVVDSGRSQRARRDQWVQIIRSSESHPVARPIARELLAAKAPKAA